MGNYAIKVEGLGKRYRIGERQKYKALRDVLTDVLYAPARGVARLFKEGSRDRREDNTIWALRDVSFEVQHGEVLGIIGRNGAGKSTLLKILSRITEPTEGEVRLRGRVGSLLEVGTGFHPELTGRENIYLNGAVLGMHRREIERKFDEIVAFAEVEKFLDTPVKHYSSGMYVRLAFAVAAHLEPEILLVDEVLAVGDAAFQKKCLGKMGQVAGEGRTVLFVSHNMGAIQELCESAILLQSGSISNKGSPEAVTSAYLRDASRSEQGIFDLSAHPGRSSRFASVIQRMVLHSPGSSSRSLFFAEDSLVVDLTLDPPRPIIEPRIAVAIEDSTGRRITTLASHLGDSQIPDLEGQCRVSCLLPRLNLGPGRYLISASVGTRSDGLLDSIDNAAWFEVGWRNGYGNGESHYRAYGPVLSVSKWMKVG
jgi:lipopolysaccharide transport system ATP-binding protein